jgi:hypothetical protein
MGATTGLVALPAAGEQFIALGHLPEGNYTSSGDCGRYFYVWTLYRWSTSSQFGHNGLLARVLHCAQFISFYLLPAASRGLAG